MQAFISPGFAILQHHRIAGCIVNRSPRAREISGVKLTGSGWPQTRVTVNMSPAAMPKRGSSYDLAIAASVLCAAGAIGMIAQKIPLCSAK